MSENTLKNKYVEFLRSFGIQPPPEPELTEIINRSPDRYQREEIPMTSEREEAIEAYIQTCKDFGYTVSEHIKYLDIMKIWDYIIRNTNGGVEKDYGKDIEKIQSIVEKKRVRDTLRILYDQRIFINKEQFDQLAAVASDIEEINHIYLEFGGQEGMLQLSDKDCDYYDEEDEEEYDEEEDE